LEKDDYGESGRSLRVGGCAAVTSREGSMTEPRDWNGKIIEEFRANGGRVGGPFEGAPVLLLHTTGARTGLERVTPLMYLEADGVYAIFATKGGAPTNPDWFHNLLAHPLVEIEVGTETRRVRASVADGEERERLWERQKNRFPNFAAYEGRTSRRIPVVILEPVPA